MRVSGARIDIYADALADARAVPRADARAGIRAVAVAVDRICTVRDINGAGAGDG